MMKRNKPESDSSDSEEPESKKMRFEALPTSQEMPEHIKDRPVRLYADGIFDMFHYGHARALEQAKKSFKNAILVVGCCSDELTHRMKGMTVMKDTERYEALRHCKWVDEVIEDAPWVLDVEFLEKHKIDFVCHDALPYTADGCEDIYAEIKKLGKFHETHRTTGVSTTELIVRILKNYEMYIRRNLSRGIERKEMNVSFMKEKGIKLGMAMDKVKDKTKARLDKFLKKWTEVSDEMQDGFLSLFSKDGALRTRLREERHKIRQQLKDNNVPHTLM
eukprot:TRINITY_DN774097_c0_g1_i1.p1 TRINITY_DN774097_c0_g1~~TRINITY_DN774097_c0_g1_i1.p1  ORF type:complete len:276 (+),score=75.34 TRINITY_DN774097_c0_g1_i1:32-859(+)